MRFRLRDEGVRLESMSSEDRAVDAKFIDFARQLFDAPGVTDGLTRGLEIESYELKISKAIAVPDNEVEKTVIQLIA